ncbi:MAG TPA: type I secretion system permease/ATPase, partial [Hyphomicrobiaceae bacterium]|nr:type I secretion system permease/ATPase [Hyphomicrobiaceae bacterium]
AMALSSKAGEAEGDRLAQAIVDLAAHYGEATTVTVITRGLPLVGGRLSVEHAAEAAVRASLTLEAASIGLDELRDLDLPAIVLINDGSADILWSIRRAGDGRPVDVEVSEPGAPGTRSHIAYAEYAAAHDGRVLRVRPPSVTRAAADGLPPAPQPGWLLQAFKSSRRLYVQAIIATLAVNLLALAMPLFTMNVYDRVLPNAAVETLWALSIGVILATLFDFAIKTLRSRVIDGVGRRADVLLANRIFGRLLGARLGVRGSTGVRANTLREYETVREFFSSATLTAFGDLPFLVLFLAMISVVAGSLVWVPLLSIPIVLAIAWVTQRRIMRLSETAFRASAQKSAVAVETIGGLETLKAAGAESFAAGRWERAVADGVRNGHALRDLSSIGMGLVGAVQTLAQVVMIIAGFYMVQSGSLTMGGLIAATMLAGRALQPLGQAAALITRLHQAKLAYRMLDEIMTAPQERTDDARLILPSAVRGSIAFEAVTVAYEKDAPPALRDVSFSIAAGEAVAIVGGIGSGKTTALKLIDALLQPTSGRVLVDGLPAAQIEPAILRASVGLALQDGEVFQGTLRENIMLGRTGWSDSQILAALAAASAADWVMRLPKGLETRVGERGQGLSSGQKQSLTLARAIVGKPTVVLLDEPTSAMDPTSERETVKRLKAALAGRTVVLVTHRPALLDLVERIIVLDGGRKVLDGPKASVLASMRAMSERAASERAKAPVRVGALQPGGAT